MNKNEILKRIGENLSVFNVDIGYVFGSFLDNTEFEDIDVAVLTEEKLSGYQNFKFSMMLARKLEQEIEPRVEFDVKVLQGCPTVFQHLNGLMRSFSRRGF